MLNGEGSSVNGAVSPLTDARRAGTQFQPKLMLDEEVLQARRGGLVLEGRSSGEHLKSARAVLFIDGAVSWLNGAASILDGAVS